MNEQELKIVIEKIMKEYDISKPKIELSTYLSLGIAAINTIKQNRYKILRKIDDIKKARDIEIKLEKDKLKENQSKCKHYLTTYYGDPSGGNDSYHICDICGAEF